MHRFLAVLMTSVAVTATASARADDSTKAPAAESWYGYQTIGTDMAAVCLTLGASGANGGGGGALAATALATYALGAPIVHIAHGRGSTAALDLGMRVAFPVLGALLGAAIGSKPGEDCSEGCAALGLGIIGFFGGALGASIVDAAALAREPVETRAANDDASPGEPSPRGGSAVQIRPTLALVPAGRDGVLGSIGALGTF